MKHIEWDKERRENEAAKLTSENGRRQWILRKREQEKQEYDRRLEESRKRLALAQANLEKLLINEKNISSKEDTSAKVILNTGFISIF